MVAKEEKSAKFKVTDHVLVPAHILLSKEEAKKILKEYNAEFQQLPKILVTDPCAKILGAEPGDIIKVIRNSPTAGKAIAYRGVVKV
ncbi:MAG: DNA-directed RNA polymerase subunit H [Candidatus Thermoplasmatota archaeon]|nr:DNA-directed RNA polymerase subunit H [Candidatus Thermoplasmatota archaeon]MDI6887667.1 DNA-directed RNA polymerase subunit H [Candidatus Thermoplasmatota archaeon]